MPRRISAEIDMQILADLGVGMLHRVIAEKYQVSPSYVSKLARGKKVPDIHVTPPPKMPSADIEVYDDDIEKIFRTVNNSRVFVSQDESIKYLRRQVQLAAVRLKVYTELLNKYQGDK